MRRRSKGLGELEQWVMEYVWANGPVSAAACLDALRPSHPLRESTVRTILHRLERKGYVSHTVDGRTYIYRAAVARESVVMRAVKQIADRFCGGSAEKLVMGMVEQAVLSEEQLQHLAKQIAARKAGKS